MTHPQTWVLSGRQQTSRRSALATATAATPAATTSMQESLASAWAQPMRHLPVVHGRLAVQTAASFRHYLLPLGSTIMELTIRVRAANAIASDATKSSVQFIQIKRLCCAENLLEARRRGTYIPPNPHTGHDFMATQPATACFGVVASIPSHATATERLDREDNTRRVQDLGSPRPPRRTRKRKASQSCAFARCTRAVARHHRKASGGDKDKAAKTKIA